jgi:hypothetical protein
MSLSSYLLTLVLSIVIECAIAYVLGYKKRKYLLTIVFINLITQPMLNYLLLILSYTHININLLLVLILEIIVALAEWGLLVHVFRKDKHKFFVLSLITNLASFLIGIIIFWI